MINITIPEENQFYAYGLANPLKPSKESYVGGDSLYEYEFFYFGYSGREERIDEHLDCKKSDKNEEKKNIIREIRSAGKEVIIVMILIKVDKYTAIKKEIEMIRYYGRFDKGLGPLTNKTNGGDGGNSGKYKRRTKEHSTKISEAKLRSNLLWYTNGKEEKFYRENEQPEGWVRGKLPMKEESKKKIREQFKGETHPLFGMKIFNNGKIEGRFFEGHEPKNWTMGRKPNAKYVTIDNFSKTLKDWSKFSGTNYSTIISRLRLGWSDKEAVFGK